MKLYENSCDRLPPL